MVCQKEAQGKTAKIFYGFPQTCMTGLPKTQLWSPYISYGSQRTEQELNGEHKQPIDILGDTRTQAGAAIVDGKDRLADENGGQFSFECELATESVHELKRYDGHLRSNKAGKDVRRSIMFEGREVKRCCPGHGMRCRAVQRSNCQL